MSEEIITLKLTVSDRGRKNNIKTLERQIGVQQYLDLILDWIESNKGADGSLRRCTTLSYEFYHSLFPETDWEQWAVWEPCSPPIKIESDHAFWVGIQIGRRHPEFAFRESEVGADKLQFVPFPDCYIHLPNGEIAGRDKIIFRERDGVYPWIIKYPGKYDVIGRLNYLLSHDDSNPVTILMRSPQPYKGMGHQIVTMLDELRDLAMNVAERQP